MKKKKLCRNFFAGKIQKNNFQIFIIIIKIFHNKKISAKEFDETCFMRLFAEIMFLK